MNAGYADSSSITRRLDPAQRRSPAGAGGREPYPILITGGGGFLGSHIAGRLLERGDSVRVFGRRFYPDLAAAGADCRQGDVADPAAVRKAVDGCRSIIHCAAMPGIDGDYRLHYAANYLGTKNVIDAAVSLGVRRLVHTSSPAVVNAGQDIEGGDEDLPYPAKYLCPYAATKALAEKLALGMNSAGFATIAIRPHLMFGPGDTQLLPKLLALAGRGRLRRVGNGKNLVSVCYVENAAHAHILALDALQSGSPAAGRAYFINEPEPVNCWDFINRLVTAAGFPEVRKSIPFPAAYAIGWLGEKTFALLKRREDPPMTRFLACQLARNHWFRVDRARRDLGWEPAVMLEVALRRTLA
ncbi:MAG: NAD-dependent epimerase/dehydratase family protein [Planctomycetota bacterium]|nr:NAD-dependent epimerase/dehydratase family protein [Planctomycetota bacterium]